MKSNPLVKYLRGEAKAKARVGEYQPSLEKALEVLLEFYGNANLILSRCKEDFRLGKSLFVQI